MINIYILLLIGSTCLPAIGQIGATNNCKDPFFVFKINPGNYRLYASPSRADSIYRTDMFLNGLQEVLDVQGEFAQINVGWVHYMNIKKIRKIKCKYSCIFGHEYTMRRWKVSFEDMKKDYNKEE